MHPADSRPGLKFDPYGFPPNPPSPNDPALRPVLAQSAALNTLLNELRKYLRQQVEGRSCLIAGPRGSGKTTLVTSAHAEVQDVVSGCRLIRVRLHGPSLLTVPVPKGKDEVADSLSEHVLKILVINLYQTAAEELSNAYRRHMENKGGEALEFAAQLRISLDGAPSAATLRYFWEKAGALSRGVLFTDLKPGTSGFRPDQGTAEIVALATAAEAYRSCTGKFERKQEDQSAAGTKQELKAELTAKGKELSQALISVASGLAVGAAAVTSQQLPLAGSALAGAVTAVASMALLNYTSTISRETTLKEQITFLPDLKAASLVHRVPLLLTRLRQAGLAPLFFIDELDKIKHLSEVMFDLAGQLKFICADQAFFCFLTDRAYIVETARINRERTNAVQRTIFTDLLFVLYETAAVHNYLRLVIRPTDARDDQERRELEADAEAARFILIHRSRMLLFELASEITNLRGSEDMLNFGPRGPRGTLVHQFHLMLQLAVEVVLSGPSVVERLRRDPDFGQTIYDALYYPTQRWYVGASKIDCSPDALVRGMAELYGGEADVRNESVNSTTLAFDGRQSSYSGYVSLPPADKEFLHANVKTMLGLVAEPARLDDAIRQAINARRMSVMQLVREAVPLQPRLLRYDKNDSYVWLYNRYGIAHEAATVAGIVSSPSLQDGESMIGTLTSSLAGLPRTASVKQVRTAVTPAEDLLKFFLGIFQPSHGAGDTGKV